MIIGVTGTICAGKDTVAKYVAERYGYAPLSFGGTVREFVVEKKIPTEGLSPKEYRQLLQKVGDEQRRLNGLDFWVNRIKAKMDSGRNYVVNGLRYVEDIGLLGAGEYFVLIGVDAPFELRYQRMRANQRGRREDEVTIEEFTLADMNDRNGAPGVGQQTQACFDRADYKIVNDEPLEQLELKVKRALIEEVSRFLV